VGGLPDPEGTELLVALRNKGSVFFEPLQQLVLQFELAEGLRKQFFKDLSREGRRSIQPTLALFVSVVRRLIEGA
jgi:hypothetical protein